MTDHAFPAIAHLLRAHTVVEERLSGELSAVHGLSLKELLLLMFLEKAPAGRLSRVELARCMHTSASTITRQAAPLEKRGLVGRDVDPRDARLSYVVLTPTGQQLVEDARATFERSSSTFFRDRWTEEEIASLSELLGRLTVSLPGSLI
jgi:DNA-binding MarR family transcriptional regulator